MESVVLSMSADEVVELTSEFVMRWVALDIIVIAMVILLWYVFNKLL